MELKKMYLKSIEREIQGVIKVDDDSFISQELEEYVVTTEIEKYFGDFFDSYKRSIDGRTDKMGVWISGFFGSGKSHFLKIVSYLLENKTVNGKKAVDYFDEKIKNKILLADIKKSGNISSDIILFNIDAKSSVSNSDQKDHILNVFEKVFNEKMGLSPIPYIAEFERLLISEKKYDEFVRNFKNETGEIWEEKRNQFAVRRTQIMNAYSKTMGESIEEAKQFFDDFKKDYEISFDTIKFAERVKDYIVSKGNDHHVVFLIDEVGQYIGENSSLMLNLQTLVEELGVRCGGKAWVVVTSQLNIDEVINVKGNDFSKIIGRFDTRLNLSSSKVDEVIKKRILEKNESSSKSLIMLYDMKESIIKNLLTFTKSAEQKNYIDSIDFVNVYPFVPYQFRLLQNVFTDIRKHGFAGKHLSEGERSLLGAFQETAKRSANEEVGYLIPFFAFYDTIEQFLDHQIRVVIEHAKTNNLLKENDIKVLKLLFMLKNIKEIPSTIDNIATLFVSNIDDDKLAIKDTIKESLRKLETQTLIQRNNEEYIFLTDQEQEINREMKNIVIDSKSITDFLKKIVFDNILTDKKFMYDNKYPFPISLYLDGIKYSQEAEMGVRVVTSAIDRGDVAIVAESMRESQYVYVKLNITTLLMEEITNILQLDEYMHQKSGVNISPQVDDIIRAKRREAEKDEYRIRDAISELIKESDIYIGGDKQKLNSRTPIERIREAFNILVGRVYSKISYVETNFNNSDIRKLFNEPMTNLLGNEIGKPNIKAYKAIEEYLKEKSDLSISYGNITIRSLLQDFEKQPYGFLTDDILYLLTRLLKDEVISLVYNSETQNVASEETLAKITNRAYYDKTIIKLRKKVNQELIINLKNIARNVFNNVSLREDEDGMMYDFKEKNLSKTASELKQKLDNYQRFDHYSYPGKNILESTIELLENIASIKDTTLFFEEVNNKKDVIKSNIESVKDVLEFFKTQRTVFDQAKDIIKIYEDNKDYTDDNKKLKELAEETIGILTMDSPYSEIHKLPSLRQQIINIMGEIYDEKSKPIIDVVQKTIEYIENTVKENELAMSIGQNFIDTCKKTINDLEKSNELKDIYAKQTYIDNIKDEFIKRVESEKRKTSAPDKPVIERKIVSVQNVMTKTYEIDSKEDIDKYVNELREKLVEELEKNKFIRIK